MDAIRDTAIPPLNWLHGAFLFCIRGRPTSLSRAGAPAAPPPPPINVQKTVAGCECSLSWSAGGFTYQGVCGDPFNEVGGSWCVVQPDTCKASLARETSFVRFTCLGKE